MFEYGKLNLVRGIYYIFRYLEMVNLEDIVVD